MKLTGVKRDVKKELFCCAVNRLDDFFFMSYCETRYKSRLITVYPCSAQHIAPDVGAGFYTVDWNENIFVLRPIIKKCPTEVNDFLSSLFGFLDERLSLAIFFINISYCMLHAVAKWILIKVLMVMNSRTTEYLFRVRFHVTDNTFCIWREGFLSSLII